VVFIYTSCTCSSVKLTKTAHVPANTRATANESIPIREFPPSLRAASNATRDKTRSTPGVYSLTRSSNGTMKWIAHTVHQNGKLMARGSEDGYGIRSFPIIGYSWYWQWQCFQMLMLVRYHGYWYSQCSTARKRHEKDSDGENSHSQPFAVQMRLKWWMINESNESIVLRIISTPKRPNPIDQLPDNLVHTSWIRSKSGHTNHLQVSDLTKEYE